MLGCPACEHGIAKEFVRQVTFDCPNCGVALRTRPSRISLWGDKLNRLSWWTLILLFLTDRAWLGGHFWMVWLIGFSVAFAIDMLSIIFPPAGFDVVAAALPARYRNLAPISNREYDQRWKSVRPLGII
jgi:hypothetical protein